MVTGRRRRFIYGQAGLMMTTLFVLSLLDISSIELFFIVSFIGFLLLMLATAPVNITPEWRTRLKWPIVLGFVLFGYIVATRVLRVLFEVLQSG